jgi:CDP-diacylglycerol---serine O-phosphatidyltransferase
MQMIRNAIPNLLTLGNLACGLVAIVLLMDSTLEVKFFEIIGWLMVGAMAFDFADGFVARALKATSPIGKELDSLSDLVSFGVLPGLMVYTVLRKEMLGTAMKVPTFHIESFWGDPHLSFWQIAFPFVGLLIPLFSAYRLAKFNVDTRQSYSFLGLPTPANALFFLSIFLIFGIDGNQHPSLFMSHDYLPSEWHADSHGWLAQFTYPILRWLHHPWVLAALTLLFSILLITEIPLLAMKFKDYTWKGNWPRYVLILISVTLLAILWYRAIPLIIILYFILSFIDTRLHKKA